jgi:hypothetical protein
MPIREAETKMAVAREGLEGSRPRRMGERQQNRQVPQVFVQLTGWDICLSGWGWCASRVGRSPSRFSAGLIFPSWGRDAWNDLRPPEARVASGGNRANRWQRICLRRHMFWRLGRRVSFQATRLLTSQLLLIASLSFVSELLRPSSNLRATYKFRYPLGIVRKWLGEAMRRGVRRRTSRRSWMRPYVVWYQI